MRFPRIRFQIGDVRRDGREGGAKGEWQAHQRDVAIEVRNFAAARNDLRGPRQRLEQRDERLGDLQDYAGADRGELTDVATELNRIAKPLLRIRQDRVTGEWGFDAP